MMLPAGNLDEVELIMVKIIARNILSWLELLINRYYCI